MGQVLHIEEKHAWHNSGVGKPQALQGGKGSSPASIAPNQPHNDLIALARGALHATRSAGIGTIEGSRQARLGSCQVRQASHNSSMPTMLSSLCSTKATKPKMLSGTKSRAVHWVRKGSMRSKSNFA